VLLFPLFAYRLFVVKAGLSSTGARVDAVCVDFLSSVIRMIQNRGQSPVLPGIEGT
jgi:hypothetical protein